MTEPRNCDRLALISGAMTATGREIWRQLLSCRPENCTHTALHLVQKLYTLLIYQGVGALKPFFNSLLLLKTPSASNNTKGITLAASLFGVKSTHFVYLSLQRFLSWFALVLRPF